MAKDKKELIIEVARAMFDRFGYRKTVIDDVVREAGIAKGTFYLYFKGKEDLFKEVVNKIGIEVKDEWLQVLAKETTIAGKIRASLLFSLDAYEKHPIFAKLSIKDEEFRMALGAVEIDSVHKELDHTLHFFRKLFEEGIRNGELREDIDLDKVPFVVGTLKFMHFHKDLAKFGNISERQFLDTLVDIVMKGIVKPERNE